MKRPSGPWLELAAALALSPLVLHAGRAGALLYFAALAALAARGALAELAAPLARLDPKDRS